MPISIEVGENYGQLEHDNEFSFDLKIGTLSTNFGKPSCPAPNLK
jgi:hypothetical protein